LQLLRRLFRTPDSSHAIPGISKRYGIVSSQDDDVLHGTYWLCLSMRWFVGLLVRSWRCALRGVTHVLVRCSLSFTRYPCFLLLKIKLTTMQLSMNVLSLALLAMTGVTADGPVRAYHPSLFVRYMYVRQLFV
jgi:hypothetical protein